MKYGGFGMLTMSEEKEKKEIRRKKKNTDFLTL